MLCLHFPIYICIYIYIYGKVYIYIYIIYIWESVDYGIIF